MICRYEAVNAFDVLKQWRGRGASMMWSFAGSAGFYKEPGNDTESDHGYKEINLPGHKLVKERRSW